MDTLTFTNCIEEKHFEFAMLKFFFVIKITDFVSVISTHTFYSITKARPDWPYGVLQLSKERNGS